MKKYVPIAIKTLLVVVALSFLGTLTKAQTRANAVVAIVNGKNITQNELDESIASQLLPLQQQLYAIRKAALDNLVSRMVLDQEASRKRISLDELRKQLTAGKVEVSQAQVEQLYSENSSVFAAMSSEEAKERLRLDLESQSRMKLYRDGVAQLRKSSTSELRLEEPTTRAIASEVGSSPVTGPKDAIVTIVEFSDFQCPYCRNAQGTLKQIVETYPGQVRIVFKHLPLEMHAQAFPSALAAVCADDQGQFWRYQNALFSSPDLSDVTLDKIASTIGLSMPKFKACLKSEASRTTILKDMKEAKQLGIAATPTFIINGKLVSGAIALEEFKTIIERALASSQTTSLTQ